MTERRQHVAELGRRASEAEAKLSRLYEAIENGLVDMSDPSLKARIAELNTIREQARGDAEGAMARITQTAPEITVDKIREFTAATRQKLRNDDGSYARNHVRAVAQRVEVVSKTEVRIRGNRSELVRVLAAASGVETAALGTRSFGPKWCRLRDSNTRPPHYECGALPAELRRPIRR